jgi:hypothetical protein
MKSEDIKVGKWYLISHYGSRDNIKGKVVEVIGDVLIMKFYWGHPFRSKNDVKINRIIAECNKPSLFSNL